MALADEFGTIKKVRNGAWRLTEFLQQTPLQMKDGIVLAVREVADPLATLDEALVYAPPGLADAAKAAHKAAQALRDTDEDATPAAALRDLADAVRGACVPLMVNNAAESDQYSRWFNKVRDELDRRHAATLPAPVGIDLNALPGDYQDPIAAAKRKRAKYEALTDEQKERLATDPEAFDRWQRHGTIESPVTSEGRAKVLAAKYPSLGRRR